MLLVRKLKEIVSNLSFWKKRAKVFVSNCESSRLSTRFISRNGNWKCWIFMLSSCVLYETAEGRRAKSLLLRSSTLCRKLHTLFIGAPGFKLTYTPKMMLQLRFLLMSYGNCNYHRRSVMKPNVLWERSVFPCHSISSVLVWRVLKKFYTQNPNQNTARGVTLRTCLNKDLSSSFNTHETHAEWAPMVEHSGKITRPTKTVKTFNQSVCMQMRIVVTKMTIPLKTAM
jgi:hypothetical protein